LNRIDAKDREMRENFLSRRDGTNRDEGESAGSTTSRTDQAAGNGGQRWDGRPNVASAEQCLAALTQLPGLVAMGLLTPAQANSMRATFATILQHHQKSQNAPTPARATPEVVQAVRNHPELATLLESLLTDEQLEALLKEARDCGDGGDG
jgi:hypothetical protein